MPNAISELLQSAQIETVWKALGGGELRAKRGVAFWRDGASRLSVAIKPGENLWYDHAANEGGGVLKLVERVLGCPKRDAIRWLAGYYSFPLDQKPLTPAELRRVERERRDRQQLENYRQKLLAEARVRRDLYLRGYNRAYSHAKACRRPQSACCSLALDVALLYEPRVVELDTRIDAIKTASYDQLRRKRDRK